MKNQRIKVMLPSYNEEQNLPDLLRRIEQTKLDFNLHIDVLVVNDGSKDGTLQAAQNYSGDLKVNVLDLQPNRGLAGAMREGFKEALKDLEDSDIVIALDADNSHNPALFYRMIVQIREGSDIVIASRYRQGSRILGLSKFREFLSSMAGYLFRILTPIKGVRDYTCGYRAYRVSILKKAHQHYGDRFIMQQGFGCMAEILLKMRLFDPIIHELPFILRYDMKLGESKMKVLKTVKQTLQLIFSSKN
jgi:dolichol-phosphate mannosyltransferase